MKHDDYAKLLIENSFKEGNLFWVRHGGYMLAQALLLGLVVGQKLSLVLIFSLVGSLFALLHWRVLVVSSHYNETWFEAFRDWVRQRHKSTDQESSNDQSSESWSHLENKLDIHEDEIPKPGIHATKLSYFIPFLFILGWVGLVIVTWVDPPVAADSCV